ncbi:UDP-glucuronosyl/UDP-glucosyltransferase [Artemisia annua]|uniref:Glycosyltransferase n=1 Tax=Artemisia annua TaxID=35608 RepID=A0A2U1K9A6_ARTAN|nr:UDP-glucuronosyl/UDP-glucosyltransferase [Artemisia annua]
MEIQAESAPKPHVAFLASPGIGHITPLYELALRLVTQHNFEVSFLVINTGSSPAQNNYLNSNQHPHIRIVDLPPADHSDPSLFVIVQESILPLRSVLSSLNPQTLKALIIDIFCTGMFEVCKGLSIPVYSFFTASAALLAFSLYLPTLDREVEGEFVDLPEPVKVPGCNLIKIQDLLNEVRNRKSDEYKWFLFHASRLSMARGILVNAWDELEPVSLKAIKSERFFNKISTPPIYPIGPLTKHIESISTNYEKEIMAWLDKQVQGSVLFVALGSGGTLTSEQLTELAWGLELSRQSFIMVVRKPNDTADAAFYSAGGTSDDPKVYLPDGFVERTNGLGLVVNSWAPQIAVLNHPSTGAFLSHCGWNSTLESVKHGVPVIGWPMYAEQRMNATILSNEVGVAVKMPVLGDGGEAVLVGRKEIERVVRMVMEGEEGKKIRSRAKELEVSGWATLSRGGSSYETLTKVTELWKLD